MQTRTTTHGTTSESADRRLLDLIRRRGPLTVPELVADQGVTATAVRNRLSRLIASGMVERLRMGGARGRPKLAYQASGEAHRRLGQNYADLAVVLWDELMRSVEDRKLRRFLFGRVCERMAQTYRSQVDGDSWEGRLVQLGGLLHDRGVEAEVTRRQDDPRPILTQHSCPYHELAEVDRAVCAMERKMFEKVLGHALRLSKCRLDGHRSCDFEAKGTVASG